MAAHRIGRIDTVNMIHNDMHILAANGAPPLKLRTHYGACNLVRPRGLQLNERYDIAPHMWCLLVYAGPRFYDLSDEADVVLLVNALNHEPCMSDKDAARWKAAASSN